ncbi:MAG: selenocysteine-specific translation elongation factor [Bdellovibrionota bacterium]
MEHLPPQIIPLMIGTAGHVDHGKTSLVKNLTGHETDRHPEERERGMSIDFGIAPFVLSDGRVAGIIDVPGHEDFIRNMVAGASSIDVLMLVVAADDSVMPQTVEHLRIVQLLGMAKLLVVVTKSDLVSPDILGVVKEELRELILRAGFPDAPILTVSNITQEGIAEVRQTLERFVDVPPRDEGRRAFRMDIRSVFSMKGHGTVLTGVPRAGSLRAGEEVEILPLGTKATVRSIQNYRRQTDQTAAHVSSAINLRDVDASTIHRGMTLAKSGVYRSVETAIALFKNDSFEPIAKRAKFRFASGTSTVNVSARLIAHEELAPGATGFMHIRLEPGLVLAAGDRYILRPTAAGPTIGGGMVLAVDTGRMRRISDDLLERLDAAHEAAESGDYFMSQLYAGPRAVFRNVELLRLTQCLEADATLMLKERIREGKLTDLGGNCSIITSRIGEVGRALTKAVGRYHLLNRYAWGMKPAYVTELLGIEPGAFDTLFGLLKADTELVQKHSRLALSSFQPQVDGAQIKQRELVLDAITKAGITSIARGSLLDQTKLTEKDLRHITKLLADEDLIVVLQNNYLLRTLYESTRQQLLQLFTEQPLIEINDFRARTQTSRNVAALILDSFDAEGMTKRTEAGRTLVQKRRPGEAKRP